MDRRETVDYITVMPERYETILDFWFGDAADHPETIEKRLDLWFGGAPETDRLIRQNFEADLLEAGKFLREKWEETPQGSLALVLLYDQFSRNIYRDRPRGLSFDPQALHIAENSIQKGFDLQVPPIQRVFFYMPMMHAEDLELQQRAVTYFIRLRNAANADWKSIFANFHHYAELHLEMIERFGRFPDRNALLGRKSTPEEIAVLKNYPF